MSVSGSGMEGKKESSMEVGRRVRQRKMRFPAQILMNGTQREPRSQAWMSGFNLGSLHEPRPLDNHGCPVAELGAGVQEGGPVDVGPSGGLMNMPEHMEPRTNLQHPVQ